MVKKKFCQYWKKMYFCNVFQETRKHKHNIVHWCNGSTSDSGSASLGSNPGWTTMVGKGEDCLFLNGHRLSFFYIPELGFSIKIAQRNTQDFCFLFFKDKTPIWFHFSIVNTNKVSNLKKFATVSYTIKFLERLPPLLIPRTPQKQSDDKRKKRWHGKASPHNDCRHQPQ